jgi:hypothetical protein
MKKRKYNKTGKYAKKTEVSNTVTHSNTDYPDGVTTTTAQTTQKEIEKAVEKGMMSFTFKDLPLSIQRGVELALANRKRLKLPDDSEYRKAMAVRYFIGDKPR